MNIYFGCDSSTKMLQHSPVIGLYPIPSEFPMGFDLKTIQWRSGSLTGLWKKDTHDTAQDSIKKCNFLTFIVFLIFIHLFILFCSFVDCRFHLFWSSK